MFYFRINRLRVLDNRESVRWFGLVDNDRAEVKLVSFVTTDDVQLPDMDDLLQTTNVARQREIVRAAVDHMVGARVLTTIENVEDDSVLTFGDTGYVLYRAEKIPECFDWVFLAIESDDESREFSTQVLGALDQHEFQGFAASVVQLARAAANPSLAAATAIGKFLATAIARQGASNRDDLIGVLYTSLNRWEHYPHGERKRDAVPDLTRNMFVDYSLFGFEAPGAANSPLANAPAEIIRRLPRVA